MRSARDRIVLDPAIRFGKPCIAGTRITPEEVVELVSAGLGPEEIRRDYYPEITMDDVEACVAFEANSRPTAG